MVSIRDQTFIFVESEKQIPLNSSVVISNICIIQCGRKVYRELPPVFVEILLLQSRTKTTSKGQSLRNRGQAGRIDQV